MLMGPCLASGFYPLFGYAGTFFTFAGIIGVIGVLVITQLPERLNTEDGIGDLVTGA